MCFIFHKWSKWSRLVKTYSGGNKQQWRECKDCGKVSFRTLMWDKQSIVGDVNLALSDIKEDK